MLIAFEVPGGGVVFPFEPGFDLLQDQLANAISIAKEIKTIIFLCVIKIVLWLKILWVFINVVTNSAGLMYRC